MTPEGLLLAALPEHLLLAGIVGVLLMDLLAKRPQDALLPTLVTLLGAAGLAVMLALSGYSGAPFPGHFSVDTQAYWAKAILIGLSVPIILLVRAEGLENRFAVLLLSSLYGAGLMLSADSLLMLFIGLELLSLPLYALVVMGSRRPESAEAALKYLVIGGVGTAVLLMGLSLTLGATGGLSVAHFQTALADDSILARGAVVLVVVAFMLKAAIVPFHSWAPDAYDGASLPATAFMATVIKGAVLLALLRLFGPASAAPVLLGVIIVLPLLSMLWGNLVALRQDRFRRLIAYSSIAHAGYLFFVLLAPAELRFQAVAFYILAYGLTTLLAFACLPNGPDTQRDHLSHLKGLYYRSPFAAILIALAMLSLAGIPPFPGFVAKFMIFQGVMASGHVTLAVLGLLASYVGIYLYLRVIQSLFMESAPTSTATTLPGPLARTAAGLSLIAVLLLTIIPGVVLAWLG